MSQIYEMKAVEVDLDLPLLGIQAVVDQMALLLVGEIVT
jgi:hypothetical protein